MSQLPVYHPSQNGNGHVIVVKVSKDDSDGSAQKELVNQLKSKARKILQGVDAKDGSSRLVLADLDLSEKEKALSGMFEASQLKPTRSH
jgi:hypothetical protein